MPCVDGTPGANCQLATRGHRDKELPRRPSTLSSGAHHNHHFTTLTKLLLAPRGGNHRAKQVTGQSQVAVAHEAVKGIRTKRAEVRHRRGVNRLTVFKCLRIKLQKRKVRTEDKKKIQLDKKYSGPSVQFIKVSSMSKGLFSKLEEH